MEYPDLEADIRSWIDLMRDTLEARPDSIPVVGDFDMVGAWWDDICDEMIDAWSPEFRQRLLYAFSNQIQPEGVDITLRYTALQIYNRLLDYSINIKKDLPLGLGPSGVTIKRDGIIIERGETVAWESTSLQVRNDLRFLIDCVRPENMHDSRTIRWEITNAYMVENWDRAFQLYDRAEQLGLARDVDLFLMRGHLQFLIASYRCRSSQPQKSLCYTRKLPPLHPFNWEPTIYDSQVLPLALLLLDSGLDTAPSSEDIREADENRLQEAIRDLRQAQQEIELPPPYRAILARCHFRVGALHSAMAEYELLLNATSEPPWMATKVHVYRAIATCHVQEGDLKKAIITLQACTDEFPRETKIYLETANLQSQNADYFGVAETLRKAAETVPDIDTDWRLSTVLALRGMMDGPGQKFQDGQIQKLRESHPGVWHLIDRTCTAHWPVFTQLCIPVREAWTVAIFLAYYVVTQEEIARVVWEETAITKFALAVEIELRSRVFDFFREEVLNNPKLKKAAQVGATSRGEAKIFSKYLTAERPLTLGQMETIIGFSNQAEKGILSDFGAWLVRMQPQVANIDKNLSIIVDPRNLASHGKVIGGAVEIEEIQRACRAIIDDLHRS